MTINNIFNTKINAISNSSSINVNNSINIKPVHHGKSIGISFPVGDYITNAKKAKNIYIDTDVIDQLQRYL